MKKRINRSTLGKAQKSYFFGGQSTKRGGEVRGCPLRKNNFFSNVLLKGTKNQEAKIIKLNNNKILF